MLCGYFSMTIHKKDNRDSRRAFLRGMRWPSALSAPRPIHASGVAGRNFLSSLAVGEPSFPLNDSRVTPHYPAKSPLDEVLRLVAPGSDEYITEKYTFEITRLLDEWAEVYGRRSGFGSRRQLLDPSVLAASLASSQEMTLRSAKWN